jgi:hypothetical protein
MINPNKEYSIKHPAKLELIERNGEVKVRSGGVIYYGWPKLPKGLVAGDKVRIKVQFSIMLDSWVIKSISKVRTKTNNEGL